MSSFGTLRVFFGHMARAVQLLAEIRDGIANLTDLTDRRLKAVETAVADMRRLAEIRDGVANLTDVTDRRLKAVESAVANARALSTAPGSPGSSPKNADLLPAKSWPGASRPLPR